MHLRIKGRYHAKPTPLEPAWLFEQISAWIEGHLAARGWRSTGAVELVHQRPWSAFAQVATDHGTVYFKAPAPMFTYEVALTEALGRWRPDCSVSLLASDLALGWMLSADAGITLRRLSQSAEQIDHWEQLLPQYSELQITLAPRMPELLALHVPDRRLAGMPQLYMELLDDTDSLLIGQADGLTPAQYQQLHTGAARFAEQCQQLAAYGLPETIIHEELHENNVLFWQRPAYLHRLER